MQTPKWQEKLTIEEIKHLHEENIHTLRDAKINFEHQKKLRKLNSEPASEPCWICRNIAKKLGEEI